MLNNNLLGSYYNRARIMHLRVNAADDHGKLKNRAGLAHYRYLELPWNRWCVRGKITRLPFITFSTRYQSHTIDLHICKLL